MLYPALGGQLNNPNHSHSGDRLRGDAPVHAKGVMSLTNEKGILHTAPPGHMALQFASGKTSAFTCPSAWSSDSTGSQSTGASFYLYVPRDHPVSRRARASSDSSSARGTPEQASAKWPLLVLIHGSRRDAQGVRDRWADWAEEHGVVILCPLFPADLLVRLAYDLCLQKLNTSRP